ncbi:winged helix-turn-helix domain-containing protein [Streptomyces sp. SLBN-134]|uniref:winged helix-turn-helix domain-containing protein n=1 Tax=Streptomyces sp. SLBN-134 TaxID=2768456 RepID=UPI001154E45B|nr:winged helix-turn-helix domain-containing protein [Streptomyces sp. SLBN-134]TQL18160.1 MarR family protein [Streptomyces sp. SLBN-134]
MVYRIHFTLEDLARTRVASPPPLMELSAAVRSLQDRSHPLRFGAWRRTAYTSLDPKARMVLDLIPPGGWAPTFLTTADIGGPHELLEQVRAIPRSQIRKDLAHVAQWQPLPPWAHHLAHDSNLLRQLCDSLDHVHAVLLSPHWAHITSEAAADQGKRMRQVLVGGMEHLLASLHPRRIRWNPPVLEIAMQSGFDGDLHLEGRGLLLTPSVFGAEAPAIDIDAKPQPVVRYPIGQEASSSLPLFSRPTHPAPPGSRSPVISLLGQTRASVLHTIADHPGSSTKELAVLIGISPPSASEHATTLRTAGLIRTVRDRNTALHSLTPLGLALLNTPQHPVPQT